MEIYVVFVFTPTFEREPVVITRSLYFLGNICWTSRKSIISELLSEHLSELLYLFHGEVVFARLHLLAVVTGEDA